MKFTMFNRRCNRLGGMSRHIINPTKKALPRPYDYPQAPPTQPTDAATTSAASRYS